jgi:hypothetical protein
VIFSPIHYKQIFVVYKRALYYNLIGLWVILALSLGIGLVIFAKYHTCDPLTTKDVLNGEQVKFLFNFQL